MKKYVIVAVLATVLTAAATTMAAPASARPTHVVCVTDDWQHWTTKVRPGSCTLHVRNGCWCHAELMLFRSAHWKAWGQRHAYAKGKETFNGGVTSNERVSLFRPRWGRTPSTGWVKFFSRARIANRFGEVTIKLDVPHGRWLP
jgi:hypothetical protein